MLSLFKTQASKDFDKAMDFLDCSRTLMSSAIETRRAIAENCSNDFAVLMELATVVKPADEFLKKNLEHINNQLKTWKLHMQFEKPERYLKVERIIKNAEKNINVAREKAIDIDHWLRFDLLDSTKSC